MDLKELERHARRHGAWTIQLTKRDILKCEYHETPAHGGMFGWDNYAYFLNGSRIREDRASNLLDGMFAQALGLSLVDIEA